MAKQTDRRKDRFIRDRIMFKLQEWWGEWWNKFLERSFQRTANKMSKNKK
jgi:hypothetical protein